MYGWAGKILSVDLSRGSVTYESLDTDLAKKFIGGRGINSKILYDQTARGVSPLSPENVIIFGTSPLSGTTAPSSPRCTVTAKSPLTGILGDANFGGFFAPHLKFAGFDHIVITGRAKEPVFLYVEDERAEIMDAAHLRGRPTSETREILKKQFGRKKIHTVCIGPAGENLVRTACVVHGHNVAGRTGMGAVMGSKNLKAIVVRHGKNKVHVADPQGLREVGRRLRKKIKQSPFYNMFATYGMAGPLDMEDRSGILAVRNFKQAGGFKNVEKVSSGHLYEKYYTGSTSCYSCSVGCMKQWEVKEGPYKGLKGTKIPEGCNAPNGPACGNAYAPSLFKIYSLCNEYGIDVLDFGCLMSYMMDWYENGVITQEETGGLGFDWGNYRSMIAMIPRIAERRGFGAVLADGAVTAAQRIGRGAGKYLNSCKGMVIGGQDLRGMKGTSLSFATSTRGCDHLRGGNMLEVPVGDKPLISPEEAVERFGSERILDHDSYEKARPVVFFQDIYTLADALQVCKFNTSHNGHGINVQDMADIFTAVTGLDADEDEMFTAANRIYTVERCFGVREGIAKKDDFFQGKWAREATRGGRFDGCSLDKKKFNMMLEDYYRQRGWDPATGIPTKKTLSKLGMGSVSRELKKLGILA